MTVRLCQPGSVGVVSIVRRTKELAGSGSNDNFEVACSECSECFACLAAEAQGTCNSTRKVKPHDSRYIHCSELATLDRLTHLTVRLVLDHPAHLCHKARTELRHNIPDQQQPKQQLPSSFTQGHHLALHLMSQLLQLSSLMPASNIPYVAQHRAIGYCLSCMGCKCHDSLLALSVLLQLRLTHAECIQAV